MLMKRLDGAQQHLQEAKTQLYGGARSVEIRLRVIATNFVVLSCDLHELVRTLRTRQFIATSAKEDKVNGKCQEAVDVASILSAYPQCRYP